MSAMDVFYSWPPVTRTMVVVSFTMSCLCYSTMMPFHWILYLTDKIYTIPPQLWRIPTSFLLTGPQFSIIMDPYFLFNYGGSLEKESPRFSEIGSFFIYIIFNAALILGLAGWYLGGISFMQPLILALAYTFSQDNPDKTMSFFIISFPGKYLPFALLGVTFVLGGPAAAKFQATGLLSAHLYDFLTRIWPQFGGGMNIIRTPDMVKRWFGGDGARPAPQARGFGTSYGAANAQPPPNPGWSNQRGPGRRLGGE